jgi:hypothetical protein
MQYKKLRGYKLNTPAGVGSQITNEKIVASDGTAVGISVGENYGRAELGKMLLTVKADGGNNQIYQVPLTQFLPEGERFFVPLPEPLLVGQAVDFVIESASAASDAANPVTIILYHTEK